MHRQSLLRAYELFLIQIYILSNAFSLHLTKITAAVPEGIFRSVYCYKIYFCLPYRTRNCSLKKYCVLRGTGKIHALTRTRQKSAIGKGFNFLGQIQSQLFYCLYEKKKKTLKLGQIVGKIFLESEHVIGERMLRNCHLAQRKCSQAWRLNKHYRRGCRKLQSVRTLQQSS